MKKLIKIGLYNPFLDTLGGGEKHILSIIATLSNIILEENKDVEINIFWDDDLSRKIEERFSNLELKKINWIGNFKNLGLLKRLRYLYSFDYFFYVTDGSYFFSLARKNFVFCMVPDKKLYQLNLINKLKLFNFKFISNSPFTSVWLKKWGIKSITIEPYIDNKFISNGQKKEKIILSVGRFFSHLHQKNHHEIIKTFINLQKKSRLFQEYKLILAGGLKNEDKNYFENLKKLANKNTSIIFKPNINDKQLIEIYHKAKYFWHFTGLGVDEEKNPQLVEHFGIAPLEAIASGCITFCHNSGGPKLVIENKINGILFNNEEELIQLMIEIETKKNWQKKIIYQGQLLIKQKYNYLIFRNKVKKYLLNN